MIENNFENLNNQQGFNHNFYLGDIFHIKGMSSEQMEKIEQGDFSSVIEKLENTPEGKERDKMVVELEGEMTRIFQGVDCAVSVAEEHEDIKAVGELKKILDIINKLTDKIRSFNSGK